MHKESFSPHCYRRACISRWNTLGMRDRVNRICSGHQSRDTHEDYNQVTDAELVAEFAKVGLLSPPPTKQDGKDAASAA